MPVSLSSSSFLPQVGVMCVQLTGNSELLAEGGQLLCLTPSSGSGAKDPGAKISTSAENRDDMQPLAEARARSVSQGGSEVWEVSDGG